MCDWQSGKITLLPTITIFCGDNDLNVESLMQAGEGGGGDNLTRVIPRIIRE